MSTHREYRPIEPPLRVRWQQRVPMNLMYPNVPPSWTMKPNDIYRRWRRREGKKYPTVDEFRTATEAFVLATLTVPFGERPENARPTIRQMAHSISGMIAKLEKAAREGVVWPEVL